MNAVKDVDDVQESKAAYSVMGSSVLLVYILAAMYAVVAALFYHNWLMPLGASLSTLIMILAIMSVPEAWPHTSQVIVKNLLLCLGTIFFVLSSCTFISMGCLFVKNRNEAGHVMFIRPYIDEIVRLDRRLFIPGEGPGGIEVVTPSKDGISIKARVSGTVAWNLSPEMAVQISQLNNPNEALVNTVTELLKRQAKQEISQYPAAVLLAAPRAEATFALGHGPGQDLFTQYGIPGKSELVITSAVPFREYQ